MPNEIRPNGGLEAPPILQSDVDFALPESWAKQRNVDLIREYADGLVEYGLGNSDRTLLSLEILNGLESFTKSLINRDQELEVLSKAELQTISEQFGLEGTIEPLLNNIKSISFQERDLLMSTFNSQIIKLLFKKVDQDLGKEESIFGISDDQLERPVFSRVDMTDNEDDEDDKDDYEEEDDNDGDSSQGLIDLYEWKKAKESSVSSHPSNFNKPTPELDEPVAALNPRVDFGSWDHEKKSKATTYWDFKSTGFDSESGRGLGYLAIAEGLVPEFNSEEMGEVIKEIIDKMPEITEAEIVNRALLYLIRELKKNNGSTDTSGQ